MRERPKGRGPRGDDYWQPWTGYWYVSLDRFIYYILERERIRIKKEVLKDPFPWTTNSILQTYKFTNVRRINDRTTRFFVDRFYSKYPRKNNREVTLYNCGVFRYFGTMEFAEHIGWSTKHDGARLRKTAKRMMDDGIKVFTGAYIITNQGLAQPKYVTVADFMRTLWAARHDIIAQFDKHHTWEAAAERMRTMIGFGGSGFMVKEILQDFLICYPDIATDALTWTPVGPGARRGLNRLYGRDIRFKVREECFLTEMQTLREVVQEAWTKEFGRKAGELSAHDIQFCLCEFDKMERVRLGQGRPRSIYKVREDA